MDEADLPSYGVSRLGLLDDMYLAGTAPCLRAAQPAFHEAVAAAGHHLAQHKSAIYFPALDGVATGTACEGCPPLRSLMERYVAAGGSYLVCPLCFDAKALSAQTLVANATLGGTVPLWQWIGDDPVVTFSY